MTTTAAPLAPAPSRYVFSPAGECTNPDKVTIPTGELGSACALLAAQNTEGRWYSGYQYGGRNLAYVTLLPGAAGARGSRVGHPTRDLAHRSAAERLVEKLTPLHAVPAAVAIVAALRRQYALSADAHHFDADGKCTNPERIAIPCPPGYECTLYVARQPDDTWTFGATRAGAEETQFDCPCLLIANGEPDRAAALETALVVALENGEPESPINRALEKWRAAQAEEATRATNALIKDRPKGKARRELVRRLVEAGETADYRAAFSPAADAPPPPPPTPELPPRPAYRTEFADLPLARIQENPTNTRRHYDPIRLRELADSLRSEGLHQPIAVRALLPGESPENQLPLGDPGAPAYELIYGHRRRRAALLAGLSELQSKIYHGLTRKQATAIALIENLQRENINAMEEAEAYAQLIADENLTQETCAERVGRARSTVANALGLLRLPDRVREWIREEKLTSEHGKALLRFVPTRAQEPQWAAEFPNWSDIVEMIADAAILHRATSAQLERGIPFLEDLRRAGVAHRIDQFAVHKVEKKQRDHAAYFPTADGDWVTFAPEHWRAEVAERERRAAEKEESARQARAAEIAKLAKNGRRQVSLQDLDPAAYRKFEGVHEPLVSLVPDGKKTAAKDATGRTTVVTDVELADRLRLAMEREIKKNRQDVAPQIEEKALKRIRSLRRVSPREFAWLVYLITDPAACAIRPNLQAEDAKRAGARLPGARGLLDYNPFDYPPDERLERERKRLHLLAKCEPVEITKTMMAWSLPMMIQDVIETGPDSLGARVLKWWLETDTLWLLEETEEGRDQLVDLVKSAPWYTRLLAESHAA